MEHPLGLFAQGIAAALGELIRQLHQQILGTALLHIRGHRAQEHAVAAKVIDLQSCAFQQLKVGEEGSLFLRRQLHHQRLQQQLGRNIPIVCRQLLEKLALVGGVLINDADLLPALGKDVGLEDLTHIAQRGRAFLHVKAQLFRRILGSRGLLPSRGGRHFLLGGRIPCRHVVLMFGQICTVRFNVQCTFSQRCGKGGCFRLALRGSRYRAVQGGILPDGQARCNRCPAVLCRLFLGSARCRQDIRVACRCRTGRRCCCRCRSEAPEAPLGLRGMLMERSRLGLTRNDGRKSCKVILLYIIFCRVITHF